MLVPHNMFTLSPSGANNLSSLQLDPGNQAPWQGAIPQKTSTIKWHYKWQDNLPMHPHNGVCLKLIRALHGESGNGPTRTII